MKKNTQEVFCNNFNVHQEKSNVDYTASVKVNEAGLVCTKIITSKYKHTHTQRYISKKSGQRQTSDR